jgi:hypothetical protein
MHRRYGNGAQRDGSSVVLTAMRTFNSWRLVATAALLAIAAPAHAQRSVELAPNAPPDRTTGTSLHCQLAAMKRAIAPMSAEARASFPAARERFERGLPPRHTFFVSTWLQDSAEHQELVFVAVDSVIGKGDATRIAGRIWSPVQLVRGYSYRQPYTFAVTELVDWMVARPDGSEEGNAVGKFMDTYVPPKSCVDASKS